MKQTVIFIPILLVSGFCAEISQASQSDPQSQALQLDQQGHQFLEQGDPLQAYEVWEKALYLYKKRNLTLSIPPVLINQSIALQNLGYPTKACLKLTAVLKVSTNLCQPHFSIVNTKDVTPSSTLSQQLSSKNRIIAQINLGKVLHSLGNISRSEDFLTQAQKQSVSLNFYEYKDVATLELAKIQQQIFAQERDRAQLITSITARSRSMGQAKNAAQQALKSYKSLFSSKATASQARLNWLSLYKNLSNIQAVSPEIKSLVQDNVTLYQDTLVVSLAQPSKQTLSYLYGRLSLAKHLLTAARSEIPASVTAPIPKALALTQAVIENARSFQDATVATSAYQIMGESYQALGQTQQAQDAFQRASQMAQEKTDWEGVFRAQRQLARIQSQQNPEAAIAAYEFAIASLENIRQDLSPTTSDIQFSFLNDVEPVYHDYMQLLLNQPDPDYQRLITLNENLRVVELTNFLQCGQIDWVSLEQLQQQKATSATVIHILDIGHEIHVIANTSDGYHHHQANTSLVRNTLTRLNLNLRSDTFAFSNESQIQDLSQILYQQLLEPLSPRLLPESTLVFSLDSTFQGFPMALLHDGTQYLIETYSISTNFGSKVPSLSSDRAPLKVLIAGLSGVSPSFAQVSDSSLAPLPAINRETRAIASLSQKSKLLLNETFTLPKLQQTIELNSFPYLHIATHGSFSSNLEDTYLLAWNQKMKLNDLEQLFQLFSYQNSSLELLVLSACETAKGDLRAALGLAGVATQSGAKSTLASLWKIEDQSSSQLMSIFYQGLKSGLPKAEALRQAQLKLLQTETYRSPYYWAPFILLGHWQ